MRAISACVSWSRTTKLAGSLFPLPSTAASFIVPISKIATISVAPAARISTPEIFRATWRPSRMASESSAVSKIWATWRAIQS